MISLKPEYVRRYKDIAWLLFKYGRSDLVQQSGLAESIGDVSQHHPHVLNGSQAHESPAEKSDEKNGGNGKNESLSRPEQLAKDLESLGPAFIKLGQLLSTRPDFLPQPYLDALARLQDDAEPAPWKDMQQVLEEEFQTDPHRIFDDLDHEPAATASLGQVHHARLHDGRRVIVKIQRPEIAASLQHDLAAFRELARFLHDHTEFGRKFQLVPTVETLCRTVTSELDYRREAQDSHILADNLKSFDKLHVPHAIDDLTRSRVLTMEFVDGAKITDLSPAVIVELDRPELTKQLFNAYLQQVMVDGVFHSDPHPGNLWLTRDCRLALLDFGMITRISNETRTNIVKLLFSISNGDGEEAARIAEQMGEETQSFNRQEFARRISQIVTDNQHKSVQQMGIGRVVMLIQQAAGEAGIIVPESLRMLGKTLMNLDRVVAILDPQFDPTSALRSEATQIMQQHSLQRFSLPQLYQSLLEAGEVLQSLPARLNTVTKRLADNQFEIKVKAIDETKLIRGLNKVANRITAGLVIAALIVGASLIMRLESPVKIWGYPALAFVFFVLAASAGCYLLWEAMFKDDKDERGSN